MKKINEKIRLSFFISSLLIFFFSRTFVLFLVITFIDYILFWCIIFLYDKKNCTCLYYFCNFYLSVFEYRPSTIESISVENCGKSKLLTHTEYSALSWNIGYGSLGKNDDFL